MFAIDFFVCFDFRNKKESTLLYSKEDFNNSDEIAFLSINSVVIVMKIVIIISITLILQ